MSGEVLTNAEMRRSRRVGGQVGRAIAYPDGECGRARWPDVIATRFSPCRAMVLCGPGNNGGDGFVVARLLAERGYDVLVAAGDGHRRCRRDGGAMARGAACRWLTPRSMVPALIVDALFGAGLSRPLDGAYRAHGRSGKSFASSRGRHRRAERRGWRQRPGSWRAAVEADVTVTFFRLKPAHLLLPGRDTLRRDLCLPISAFRTDAVRRHPPVRKFARAVGFALSWPSPMATNMLAAIAW